MVDELAEEEEAQPEFVYNKRGLLLLFMFFIFSCGIVYLGHSMENVAVELWGYIFITAGILALFIITPRMLAYSVFAERLRRTSEEQAIMEKIRKYLAKKQAEGSEVEEEDLSL